MMKKEPRTNSWSFLKLITREQRTAEIARKQMERKFKETWNRWGTGRKLKQK